MKKVTTWEQRSARTEFDHPLLKVEIQELSNDASEQREVVVLNTDDWCNIIAINDQQEVVLIKQWRFGTAQFELEIPGGVVEPGEAHRDAAHRELLEETGYFAHKIEPLGNVAPNPAIQGNRCSLWLATELELKGEAEGDGEERIELRPTPLSEIAGLINDGTISHSLVICSFFFLAQKKGTLSW